MVDLFDLAEVTLLPRPLNSGDMAAALRYRTGLASVNSMSSLTDNGRNLHLLSTDLLIFPSLNE